MTHQRYRAQCQTYAKAGIQPHKTIELISEIASASAGQNDSIKQITSGVEQISQVIRTNSATAEETAASCEQLSGQSRILKDQVLKFKVNH